jgi:hypothetical protein
MGVSVVRCFTSDSFSDRNLVAYISKESSRNYSNSKGCITFRHDRDLKGLVRKVLKSSDRFEKTQMTSPYLGQGIITPPLSGGSSPIDVQKALQAYQRKREYNQAYYQTKTKPRKEQEKAQLGQLSNLESLYNLIDQLQAENASLRSALDHVNRKNNELMILNARNLLPNLNNLSLT